MLFIPHFLKVILECTLFISTLNFLPSCILIRLWCAVIYWEYVKSEDGKIKYLKGLFLTFPDIIISFPDFFFQAVQ